MQTLKGPGRDPEPVTNSLRKLIKRGCTLPENQYNTDPHKKKGVLFMEDSNIMTISKIEYEHLVRQSERIRILERMLADSKKRYIDDDFVRQVLNQPLREKE